MYAKLIIYQQEPVSVGWPDELVINTNQPGNIVANQLCWQLTADNLTTGNLTELLVCLDELGFSDEMENQISKNPSSIM